MTLDEALETARSEAEIVEKVGGIYQPRAVVTHIGHTPPTVDDDDDGLVECPRCYGEQGEWGEGGDRDEWVWFDCGLCEGKGTITEDDA